MFYLPDGMMHNIYVFPVIHGVLPTVTFLFLGTSRHPGRASLSGGGSKLPELQSQSLTPKRTTSLRTTSLRNLINFSSNRWARRILINNSHCCVFNAYFY